MTTDSVPRQFQLLIGAVLVGFLGWVVYLIRWKRLSLRDSFLWLLSTLSALALVTHPGVLFWGAHALGVVVPVNAVFALALLYVMLNQLVTTVSLSRMIASVRRLTQECALLRGELDGLRRDCAGGPTNETAEDSARHAAGPTGFNSTRS